MTLIHLSRDSCVQISSISGKSKGTGFFIDDKYVVTCFHVIASIAINQNKINYSVFQDLKVMLSTSEEIKASCITLPSQTDLAPLRYDFAILKLDNQKIPNVSPLDLAQDEQSLVVGEEVIFSGYPLATPGMVTHKGMVSGWSLNKEVISIQAAINKGNSGGALLDSNGQVIGIISMREGEISKGLEDLQKHIDATSQQGNVRIMGVDPLQATNEVIRTLDTYISTGIGYARSIKYLRNYISSHPLH